MRKYLMIISVANLILVAFIMGIFFYWSFYPDKIVTMTAPVTVDKEVYHWGDHITYTFSYCKTRKLTGKVVRALVNSTRTTFTTIESDLAVGCRNNIQISDLVVPSYTSPGLYHLETTVEYKINPIRSFNVYWQSNEFRIE